MKSSVKAHRKLAGVSFVQMSTCDCSPVRMRLYMDDMLEKAKEGIRLDNRGRGVTAPQGSTYLGGMPDRSLANLTGCISNVFIKR